MDTDGDGKPDECQYADHENGEASVEATVEPSVESTVEATAEPTPESTLSPDVCLAPKIRNEDGECVEPITGPIFEAFEKFEVSEDGTGVLAGWVSDPLCRAAYRWWDGEQWTERVRLKATDSVEITDPILDSDLIRPLEPDHPQHHCGFMEDHYPLTCAAVSPAACTLDSESRPTATRVMAYREIKDSLDHPYERFILHRSSEGDWPNLSDEVALSYLTDCLTGWDGYVMLRLPFVALDAPAELACNVVWALMAYPVNTLLVDVDCAWENYKEVFFRGGDRVSSRVLVGYAEVCDSWLDPEPDRPLNERCEDLYHRVDPSGAYIRELRDGLQCLFNPTRRLAQTRDDPLERIESTGRCGELSLLSEILAASWVSTPLPPEYKQVSQQTQIYC